MDWAPFFPFYLADPHCHSDHLDGDDLHLGLERHHVPVPAPGGEGAKDAELELVVDVLVAGAEDSSDIVCKFKFKFFVRLFS